MTPGDQPLVVVLAVAPVVCLALAAAAALLPRQRWLCGAALGLAIGSALAGALLPLLLPGPAAAIEAALLTWSPLGLYGVPFVVRPGPAATVLLLPALLLAALGEAGGTPAIARPPLRQQVAGHAGRALVYLGLAATAWVTVSGDLVSLFCGTALFLLVTCGWLWTVAGAPVAGRRLLLVAAAGTGLLSCVLVLGKVNGQFQISQLSTVGFTTAAFGGLLLTAAVAVAAPPFHGWLMRLARQPLAPAIGAAGVTIALALLLAALRITDSQFSPGWQRTLLLLGWLAALACPALALVRRRLVLRLAALYTGHAGVIFLAAAVATPAALAAALLYVAVTLPGLAVLWRLSQAQPSRERAMVRAAPPGEARVVALPSRRRALAPRHPGFWLYALLLAHAAGLPGTTGGLAKSALVGALIAWPAGSGLLRLPPFVLDAMLLVVAGSLLWQPGPLGHLHGRRGWLAVAAVGVILVAPVVAPHLLIGSWFDPAAAAATGMTAAPLPLHGARVPATLSVLLALAALVALVQRLRGREWLPGPLRAVLAALAVAWAEGSDAWRRNGVSTIPAAAVALLWHRTLVVADRAMRPLYALEERYYAAAAVMLAVAIIYAVGR